MANNFRRVARCQNNYIQRALLNSAVSFLLAIYPPMGGRRGVYSNPLKGTFHTNTDSRRDRVYMKYVCEAHIHERLFSPTVDLEAFQRIHSSSSVPPALSGKARSPARISPRAKPVVPFYSFGKGIPFQFHHLSPSSSSRGLPCRGGSSKLVRLFIDLQTHSAVAPLLYCWIPCREILPIRTLRE